uniref:Putative membrane protein n=1 Tax=Talaromyces marneffei PM1 TaxID=1077442 RepID=A0A093VGK9_TALMA
MSATASIPTPVQFAAMASSSDPGDHPGEWGNMTNARDLATQLVLSVTLGMSALFSFCLLRPKWKELYAARRKRRNAASFLPELPDSLFGWIPVVYRITDEEVLESAGLDAYVLLSFFKFAVRFLSVTFAFATLIIMPLHLRYAGQWGVPGWDHDDDDDDGDGGQSLFARDILLGNGHKKFKSDPTYLWIYVIFPYVFTGIAIYLLIQETNKIIRIRQKYLGSQTSTTDRTFRLSGIPTELRSEEKIQEIIEDLHIGKVEAVTLCRKWHELDLLMEERKKILRPLERAYTKHLGYKQKRRYNDTLPLVRGSRDRSPSVHSEATEHSQLLGSEDGRVPVRTKDKKRPTTRLWYGPFKLRYKNVDSIDYYEEKLRRVDERIIAARQKDYPATDLAFVTMETISACQLVVQTIIDPHPTQLVPSLAPAPADVVWKNTYLARSSRISRSWVITVVISFLTIFWSVLLVPIASLLNLDTLHKAIPGLADLLARHPIIDSLVRTGLPTITISLLTVAVPYLYAWLSSLQGMTSRGDLELSIISKNFFFTFFNLFFLFTVLGSASNFYGFFQNLQNAFKDAATMASVLATSLENLSKFYINLIILQGLGLFPFRLLEFGSVIMYPINVLYAKTPREYAELSTPPKFSYGFTIPQTIFIFIICVVYSVFPSSWLVCFCGLIYFFLGHFIYKYQLLYAMDHQQHSTGRAWPMICSRVLLGLVVFQVAMIGVLALRKLIARSLLLVPLLGATVWFTYFFAYTYEPLMKFIALRSIDQDRPDRNNGSNSDDSISPPSLLSPLSGLDATLSISSSVDVRLVSGSRNMSTRIFRYHLTGLGCRAVMGRL